MLCEKPFANNAAEAVAVQRASEDAGKIAIEAFHPLHHPVANRARELVVLNGAVGKLSHIDVQFMVNFSGYDEGIRSKSKDFTFMLLIDSRMPDTVDDSYAQCTRPLRCMTTRGSTRTWGAVLPWI